MAAADNLLFALWIISFLPTVLCCPELCTCSDKYGRHFTECSYKYLTAVPEGLPPNVTTLSLSANQIVTIPVGSFDNVTQVTSLWMANNELSSVEEFSLVLLVHLRYFDISHNKLADFPWADLKNLTALELLKMNHNKLSHLPKDAFSNLKNLRSLRLNNNRFKTIAEGTFDGLVSLSHLQIFNNPFVCTCTLDWLRNWISLTTISITEQSLITCATPKELRGEIISKLPESKCTSPNVTILTVPHVPNMVFHQNTQIVLICDFKGNPKPLVVWNISSRNLKEEMPLSLDEDSSEEAEDNIKVFNNGTLLISSLRLEDSGDYSCSATNGLGRAENFVSIKVIASPSPTPSDSTIFTSIPTNPSIPEQKKRKSVLDYLHLAKLKRKFFFTDEPTTQSTDVKSELLEDKRYLTYSSKCGLTANTKNISSHVLNASLDNIQQYTFNFGVIELGVSETEATVRLSPLLIPKNRSPNGFKNFWSDSEENSGFPEFLEKDNLNGLYLCIATDSKQSAVQWSQIKEGVNTYLFSGLEPGTNYSLCLTYRGEDCEVQVLFATRRSVPNLIIIISVSICLLTVSTVPLLGATCFHLVYKYRNKTYKLILKAKDQYHIERKLTTNLSMHAPITESRRKINEDDLEMESVYGGEKEVDTEESVITESFTCKGNIDDSEMGSEYSDRLPLGAEAVNITSKLQIP
ncbi:immunoglobulin superfamily containing leucine-rich repeat protein 2-like [Cyprinodon tularosa]|uniref:immunoglobulin superfamily containing leucine-rich repeat protein 2-like n=1 Tax=Cyprinodon tularosa TaxID=77115 RepID=UPI0018E2390D|nr:immunoglobulin superfamily containing leucine-rich repeat protein 2-like [Cyprinodon tularosa]